MTCHVPIWTRRQGEARGALRRSTEEEPEVLHTVPDAFHTPVTAGTVGSAPGSVPPGSAQPRAGPPPLHQPSAPAVCRGLPSPSAASGGVPGCRGPGRAGGALPRDGGRREKFPFWRPPMSLGPPARPHPRGISPKPPSDPSLLSGLVFFFSSREKAGAPHARPPRTAPHRPAHHPNPP